MPYMPMHDWLAKRAAMQDDWQNLKAAREVMRARGAQESVEEISCEMDELYERWRDLYGGDIEEGME